jgi:hypothetical protein
MQNRISGNCYYPIYNRATGMINVFEDDRSRPFFIAKLQKHLLSIGYILASCLIKDYFYFVPN